MTAIQWFENLSLMEIRCWSVMLVQWWSANQSVYEPVSQSMYFERRLSAAPHGWLEVAAPCPPGFPACRRLCGSSWRPPWNTGTSSSHHPPTLTKILLVAPPARSNVTFIHKVERLFSQIIENTLKLLNKYPTTSLCTDQTIYPELIKFSEKTFWNFVYNIFIFVVDAYPNKPNML